MSGWVGRYSANVCPSVCLSVHLFILYILEVPPPLPPPLQKNSYLEYLQCLVGPVIVGRFIRDANLSLYAPLQSRQQRRLPGHHIPVHKLNNIGTCSLLRENTGNEAILLPPHPHHNNVLPCSRCIVQKGSCNSKSEAEEVVPTTRSLPTSLKLPSYNKEEGQVTLLGTLLCCDWNFLCNQFIESSLPPVLTAGIVHYIIRRHLS